MASQSLYRKYRSQNFRDLVGQDHVTTALRNAVREDRVGHAYLFSGPRGTGKTSSARILAKALNCTNLGADGEPCGVCDNCVAITNGRFLDLFELDAASNNSVDNIRSLIETVNLGVGMGARTKVYLIDEVHMLSTGASNALLKTLEEPPGHVVFVLATTNPEKVLPTIRSRTQHFEFRLLTVDELRDHLASVLDSEGIAYDLAALEHIARRASGSARDALSLLDQAIAHEPQHLTTASVDAALGGLGSETRLAILNAVADEDVAGALVNLHTLLDAGHDARRVADDLLAALRDAFLAVAAAGRVRVEGTDEELAAARSTAERLGNAGLVRAIETLGAAIVDMRGGAAPDAQLVLEVALLRLARRDAATPVQALMDRIERLERQVAAMGDGTLPTGASPAAEAVARAAPVAARPRPAPATDDVPAPAPNTSAPPLDDASPSSPPARRPKAESPPAAPDAVDTATVGAQPTLGALRRDRPGTIVTAPPAAAPSAPASTPAVSNVAPSEAPAPTTVPDADDDVTFTLDDVIVAWSAALEAMPTAIRRAIDPAQPIRVEGHVITFGIPPTRFDVVSARFRQEAVTVRAELTNRLGASPRFAVISHDPIDGGTGRGANAPHAEPSGPDSAAADPPGASPPGAPPKDPEAPKAARRAAKRPSAPPADTAPADTAPVGLVEPPEDDIDLEEYIDPRDLENAPAGAGALDSVSRLQDAFGATVVQETARDNG